MTSYVGVMPLTRESLGWAISNGVRLRHFSLLIVVRNEPVMVLPPDLVIVLTTPPANRPNSAEMEDVDVLVSSMESSMKRSRAVPRTVSFTTTPLTRNSPS